MRTTHHRRVSAALAVTGASVILLAGCSSGTNDDGPMEEFTIVVPTSAGGGVDTAARQLQPYLEDILGMPVVVENHEGGGTTIGTTYMLENADNCSAALMTAIPHINLSYLTNEVDFDLDSFAPIGGISVEPGVIRVAEDAPWATLEDLIDDARERPGEISFSVSEPVSANVLGLMQIEEAAGVDFNIIPFDGGGPARLAVESGEVDATHAGVFNSLPIAETTRVLAVQYDENDWPEETDDAPTVNDALGVDAGISESTYNLWTSATCADDDTDAYDTLVSALDEVVASDDLAADLEEVGEQNKLDYRDPDQVMSDVEAAETELLALMDENPDLFTQ